MTRSDFLKALGISAMMPSVLISSTIGNEVTQVVDENKQYKYPIYPDVINAYRTTQYGMETIMFTYVKIEREGHFYLIPVKESGIGDGKKTKERFEYMVNNIQKDYIVDEWQVEMGFAIKYNKSIHG